MLELEHQFILNTPLGPALCWAVTRVNAVERFMLFHTWQLETKEPWDWSGPDVRIAGSTSARRGDDHTPIYLSDDRLDFLRPAIARHRQSPFYDRVVN